MIADVGNNPEIVNVSSQGSQNMHYYGIPDWMYEGMLSIVYILHLHSTLNGLYLWSAKVIVQ